SPAVEPSLDSHLPETKRKAFALLLESLEALRRENKEVLWSSMVKDTMKRKKPSFNETYHGYRTFSELLEDAQREGLLELDTDKRSRTYVVSRFGSEMKQAAPAPAGKVKSRRRRSAGKRRSGSRTAEEGGAAGSGRRPRERPREAAEDGHDEPSGAAPEAPPAEPELFPAEEPPPAAEEEPPAERERPHRSSRRESRHAEPAPHEEPPAPSERDAPESDNPYGLPRN